MSNYKRLISYIYSYVGGVKTKNSGFAKVEARDSECKISISLKIVETAGNEEDDNELEVFMFTRKDGKVYKTNIGTTRIVNGNSLFRAQYDEQKIGNKQFPLSDIAGIFICDKPFLNRTGNGNIVYASEWDDTTVLVDEFLDESEEVKTEQRSENIGRTMDMVEDDIRDNDGDNSGDAYVQSQSSIVENHQSQNQSNAVENSELQKRSNAEENSKLQKQSNAVENSKLQKQSNAVENSELQKQSNAVENSELQKQSNAVENSELQKQSNAVENSKLQKQSNAVENSKLHNQITENDRKADMSAVELKKQDTTYFSRVGNSNIRIDSKNRNENSGNYNKNSNSNENNGSNFKNSSTGNNINNLVQSQMYGQEKPETKEDIKKYQEQLQNLIMNPAKNADNSNARNNHLRKEDYFTMLCNCYPNLKIEGLSDRCLKITPHDISYLPRRYWHLGNNSFLLHGFYNYRYILLCQETLNINESDNAVRNSNENTLYYEKENRYMICVPGIYQKREQTIARTYGFSDFKEIPQENVKNFGYWCFYL